MVTCGWSAKLGEGVSRESLWKMITCGWSVTLEKKGGGGGVLRDVHMWLVSKTEGKEMMTCGLSVTLKKGDRGTMIES